MKDLIQQWKPVCNTQFELIAEEARRYLRVRDKVYSVRYEADNPMWPIHPGRALEIDGNNDLALTMTNAR